MREDAGVRSQEIGGAAPQPANEQEEYEAYSTTVDMLGKLWHDLPVLTVAWEGESFETRCHSFCELAVGLRSNYETLIFNDIPEEDEPMGCAQQHAECWKTKAGYMAGLPADLEFDAYYTDEDAGE